MIYTDTRGSLDERNPTFFGRFPQKHTVVFLSTYLLWHDGRSAKFSMLLDSLLLCYICVTSVLLLWRYFCEYCCVTLGTNWSIPLTFCS